MHAPFFGVHSIIPDYQIARNAKIVPRKSKKDLYNPNIIFWIFNFSVILTFEYKFDRMRIVITIKMINDANTLLRVHYYGF